VEANADTTAPSATGPSTRAAKQDLKVFEGEDTKLTRMSTLDTDITALQGKQTAAAKSGNADEARRLGEQIAALKTDRSAGYDKIDEIAKGMGPEAEAIATKARTAYRAMKQKYNDSVPIGKASKKDIYGQDDIADPRLLPALLDSTQINTKDINTFLDILDNPKAGSQKEAVRRGLAGLYADKVAPGGKVSLPAHRAFIQKYGTAGKRLWGDRWEQVSKIGNMATQVDALTKTRDKALENFNKMLPTKLAGVGPEGFKPANFYSDGLAGKSNAERVDMIKAYKLSTARANPELWDEFVALRRDDLVNDLMGENAKIQKRVGTSERVFVPKKLNDILNGADSKEQIAEMKLIFGNDFVENWKKVNQAAKIFDPDRKDFERINPKDSDPIGVKTTKTVGKILKTVVGYFGPAGRTVTRIEDMSINAQRKTAAAMVEDPEFILQVAKAMQNPKNPAINRRLLKIATDRGIIAAMDKDEEQPTDDKDVQQPPK